MIIFIYNLLNVLILPFWIIFIFYRCLKGKDSISRVGERFGLTSAPAVHSVVWLHAASVGESMSIIALIEKIKLNYPNQIILMTSGTITSAKIIKDKLRDKVLHQFLPIDNYICVKLFLRHWQPKLAIIVDSEFWPCIITETAKKCPVISLNTRISDRSFLRWKKYGSFIKPLISSISMFFPQSKSDLAKLNELGAENLYYFGNLKYCTSKTDLNPTLLNSMQSLVKDRKMLLAASTHNGEEVVLTKIFRELDLPKKLLVIAPRHPIRSKEIERQLLELGLNIAVRSRNEAITKSTNVYLADTLGELDYFYSVAPVSIIGNSICHDLGHNPIEPARYGSVVVTGPGYSNFKEVYEELFANKAAFIICSNGDKEKYKDAAMIILELFNDQKLSMNAAKNALKVVEYHQETLQEVLMKLAPYLE